MKVLGRTFFGKVMLFGEYTVISGSYAAILPFSSANANLALPDGEQSDASMLQSNKELQGFYSFLKKIKDAAVSDDLDLNKMKDDLERGLFFYSTIPEKYGLGSSGAVCAAVLEYYGKDDIHWKQMPFQLIKEKFASMESYFHGSSSGVDPLSIYLGEPLIIRNGECIIPGRHGDFCNNQIRIFLIDTMQQGETRLNMTHFKNQMKDADFHKWFNDLYIPMVNRTVEEWMSGMLKKNTIFDLSRAQFRFLNHMIPSTYDEIWLKGMDTGLYALKICGSGGGGMLLGFTDNLDATRSYLKKNYNINLTTL